MVTSTPFPNRRPCFTPRPLAVLHDCVRQPATRSRLDMVASTPFPNRRPCFLPSLLFLSAALDLQFPRHTFLCRDGLTTRPLNATALNFHKGLHIMVACYAERMTVDMIVWTWARSLFTRPNFPFCRCIYPPHWRTSTSGHRGAGVRVHVCYGTMQSLDKPSSQACGAP